MADVEGTLFLNVEVPSNFARVFSEAAEQPAMGTTSLAAVTRSNGQRDSALLVNDEWRLLDKKVSPAIAFVNNKACA